MRGRRGERRREERRGADSASNAEYKPPQTYCQCPCAITNISEQLRFKGLASLCTPCLNNWIYNCVCGLEDLTFARPYKTGLMGVLTVGLQELMMTEALLSIAANSQRWCTEGASNQRNT